jgi:hypothetical protein
MKTTVKFKFRGKRRQRTFDSEGLARAEKECEKYGIPIEKWCEICAQISYEWKHNYRECLVLNSRGTAFVDRKTRECIKFDTFSAVQN